MKTKGKLLKTEWLPTDAQAVCYSCQFHANGHLTPEVIATRCSTVRVKTFERQIQKTYFCALHATAARLAAKIASEEAREFRRAFTPNKHGEYA
jgi:hypothetical protein